MHSHKKTRKGGLRDFMHAGILVINLKTRPDRMTALQKSVAASDLRAVPMIRVEAVDGRKVDYTDLLTPTARTELADLKTTGKRKHHAQLSPGAIGCYLSHYEVWRTIASTSHTSRDTPFLVLEDDADIPQNAHVLFQHGWNAVQAARQVGSQSDAVKPYLVLWNIICLHGCDVPDSNLYEPEAFWSLMAYSLTPNTAAALLQLPLFPIDVQLDTALYMMKDSLRIFAFPCVRSGNSQTDIQVSIVPNAPLRRPESPFLNRPSSDPIPPLNREPEVVVVAPLKPLPRVENTTPTTICRTCPSAMPYIVAVVVLTALLLATAVTCIGLGVSRK